MKKKLQSIVTAAALASTAQAEPTKGYNAAQIVHTGDALTHINVGYDLKDLQVKYHSTHLFTESTFSNNRLAVGVKDNPISVFMGYDTDYKEHSEFNVGIRFEKPIGDYGYIELSTNGKSVSLAAVTGKFVEVPKVGKIQFEMLNKFKHDGDKLSQYHEFYALKGDTVKPFVMASTTDLNKFTVYAGVRWKF